MAGVTCTIYVQGRKKQGMSRRRLQWVFSCGSECSSGFCPEPTALHHCVRGYTKGVSGKMNTLKFRNGEEWPAN